MKGAVVYRHVDSEKGIEDTEENHLPTKELNDEFLSRGVHWSCHYNGSATSYCLIGNALAKTLIGVRSTGPTDVPSEPLNPSHQSFSSYSPRWPMPTGPSGAAPIATASPQEVPR